LLRDVHGRLFDEASDATPAKRIDLAGKDVAQVGIDFVGLEPEQHRRRRISFEARERDAQRPTQHGFLAHVVIGRQQEQLRLGIARQHLQDREQHADRSAAITWLHEDVLHRHAFERRRPPFAMLLCDDRAHARSVDDTSRAVDGVLEQRATTLERTKLLRYRRPARPSRQRAQSRAFATTQNDRPHITGAFHGITPATRPLRRELSLRRGRLIPASALHVRYECLDVATGSIETTGWRAGQRELLAR